MQTTIAALASGSCESAVSIIRLSGPKCRDVLKRGLSIESPVPRKMARAAYRASNGDLIDDVLAVFFKAPHSYTGEDCAEIYCHGNPFIVQNILQDLFSNECEPASPGEFTRRAFLNDKMDLSQAEAVALVIGARCKSALAAAQKQLSGGLGEKIMDFNDRLVRAYAITEAYIDFPDEDLPKSDKQSLLAECESLARQIEILADTSRYSALLHGGINAVITGAPNAGKSSLLNALMGAQRAIVSPVPGTTRDFISEKLTLGDYCVNIIDTAGLRPPSDDIENMGMEMAVGKIDSADIRILTIDATLDSATDAIPDAAKKGMNVQNTVVALNKCDLPGANPESFESFFNGYVCVRISCTENRGIGKLKGALCELIGRCHIKNSPDDIVVSARHADWLVKATEFIKQASRKIAMDAPSELAASDMRCALDALGEIVGKTDNEAVLDKIFSEFCIGK